MNVRIGAITTCAMLLGGCAAGAASSPPGAAPAVMRQASAYNISWNKAKLRLSHGAKRAVLTFWGPDGYFTYPYTCDNGSKIAIAHGIPYGDSSGYEHVVYRFRAKSAGPDTCSFDAVLNNTGSPPVAVIDLTIAP